MADRPIRKRTQSDMEEDPVFEVVKEPQCADCAYNQGLKCSMFGQKPVKYSDALSGLNCPSKKIFE